MTAAASDPTQAFAAVGRSPGQSGMTWGLPSQPAPHDPTQALPAQPAPPEPDPYADLFRPEGGSPPHPNATQVMAPVDPGMAMAPAGYDQPAYDQPIDYQAGGGGHYSEPYDGGYADDYDGEPAPAPRSSRAAMIGIGVAAGAILVIVVSLITIGGGTPTPAATPGSQATEIVTPGSTSTSAAPATTSTSTTSTTTSSSPSTTASSTVPHPPGTLALGDTGGEVKWLQAKLKQLHLYSGGISGTFDQATQAAVIVFQGRAHTADPSGIVGRSTKTALIAAGSQPRLSMVLPGGEKHGKGANPDDVKRLQRALSSALNQNIKATGQYDMETFAAVARYQGAEGMAPDGVVGDKVWSALQQGKIVG